MHEAELGETDPRVAIQDLLEAHDIAAAVLLPLEPVNAFTDPLTAAIHISALNRYFVETWLPADPRFHLTPLINPLDVPGAVAETRRYASTPRVVGVLMPLPNTLMGDGRFYPIYRAAQTHALSVVVHPTGAEGIYYGAPVLAGGPPSSGIERHVDLPQVAQASINSLIMQGVFERFTSLRVVFAGFGCGWLFPLLWRMDMDWRRLRREVPWVKRLPTDYVRDHVRVTLQPDDLPDVAAHRIAALELMKAERTLLYSSDYPRWYGSDPRAKLVGMPGPLVDRVRGINAIETFGRRLAFRRAPARSARPAAR